MQNAKHERFRGADWYPIEWPILIVGAGGIGSWLTLNLASIGVRDLVVFDDDKVEEHNLGGQFYGPSDIGKHKVTALADRIFELRGERIHAIPAKYGEVGETAPVMISAVDSHDARRKIFDRWCSSSEPCLFIDGRLLLEDFFVYAVTDPSEQREPYLETLSADEGEEIACTLKQTTGTAMMLSEVMANLVKSHYVNQKHGVHIRPVPFSQSYSGLVGEISTTSALV